MANLVTNVTANGATAGVSITGPCALHAIGSSVYDGANLRLELSSLTDTAADYAPIGYDFKEGALPRYVDLPGTYFLRVVTTNVGTNTDVSIEIQQ